MEWNGIGDGLVSLLFSQTRTGALTLNPVVAGRSHLAVHDSPDFLGQVLGELTGVGNDNDTTLERLESLGQGTQRVTVEVVGGLVEDDDVRTLPRAGGEDDLDTLTTGETAHTTELTAGEGLLLVDIGNHLGVGLDNLATRNPGVVIAHHRGPLLALHADVLTESERAFVLVAVLELTTSVDTDDTAEGTFDLVNLVHGLLVILGDDLVGAVHGLTVLTGLETPLNVLRGSLVEVVIDVSESMLLDVGDTDVLVLVDITAGGDELTSQDVDEGGFTSTVGTDNGNTRAQRDLEGDVGELGPGSSGVLEGHVADTDDGLGLGLDTLEETRLGELELHVGGAELIVGTSAGNLLDELAQVTAVTLELEALVVNDVLDNIVQELAVVGDDDGSARRGAKVVLQPGNVLDIQVVGRLVKEQNVGVLEHGTGKSQLHLPTTRQRGDGAFKLLTEETELLELGLDLGLGDVDTDLTELLHGPANDGLLSVGGIQVVLNVDSLDLVLLGETFKLLVVDGAHQSSLTGTVRSEKTVTLTTLQAERGLVQQDLGTIGQRERAVAEIFTLLLVGQNGISLGSARRSTLAQSLGNGLGFLLTNNGGDVGKSVMGPAGDLGVLLINKLTSDGTDIVDDGLRLLDLSLVLGGEDIFQDTSNGLNVTGSRDLGDLAILDITDTGEGVQGLLGLLTGLRIGKSVVVLLETGHQLGQERSDNLGVLHELTHVVDNDGGLTLDGSLALNETTVKQRDHDGKSRTSDIGNESGSTEQVNSLGNVLGLGDTLDELGNEALNILVDDQTANLLHCGVGSLLDIGLGVPHGLGHSGDQFRHTEGELSRGGLDEAVEAVKSAHLLLPLLGILEGVQNDRHNGLDSVGVDTLHDGEGGSLGSLLNGSHLVTGSSEDGAEERDEVGLNTGSDGLVGGDSANGLASTLTGSSILLVVELLLECIDSPE
ncbi:hypothetical protein IFM46972_11263 [Aspergillus udagawae]|uniref:Uncharacterized protein n=1 Tax=Aspergillus udagawae TaxID=91492 RepID=A0A8H3SG08_9EURO|nr:hypothetical protein IFM46972_11263 [Aspergillus udagawae]